MNPAAGLSLSGFSATLLTYGPARVGFGLFLPELRTVFDLSSETAGNIASLGFAGFLAGLLGAGQLGSERGGHVPVLVGLVLATLGVAIVALSQSVWMLALGIVLAMLGPGLTWSPFNTLVHDEVRAFRRPGALSVISTGTSLGVVMAGAAGIVVLVWGISWRWAWAFFTVIGIAAVAVNWQVLTTVASAPESGESERWSGVWLPAAAPLYALALSFGITTAVYITFAARAVEAAGGLPGLPGNGSAPAIFVCLGLFGLTGIVTAKLRTAIGLRAVIALLMLSSALSCALIALSPTSWLAVMASSGLQGIFIMMVSAVLSFWSERVFTGGSLLGFTTALLFVAGGSVIGPAGAGQVLDAWGFAGVFLSAAALSACTVVLALPRRIPDR